MTPPGKIPVTHLYRGAPPVRGWSKYQETDEAWTLCGIRRKTVIKGRQRVASCTEDPGVVTCTFCLHLMRPEADSVAKKGQSA